MKAVKEPPFITAKQEAPGRTRWRWSCCTPWPTRVKAETNSSRPSHIMGLHTYGGTRKKNSGPLWTPPPLYHSWGMQATVLVKQGQLLTCFARTPLAEKLQSRRCTRFGAGTFLLSWKSWYSRLLSPNHPASSRVWLLMQCSSLPADCCTIIYLSA